MAPKGLVVPVDQEQDLQSQVAISPSVPPDLPDRINRVPADPDKADLRDLPECRVDLAVPVAPEWEDLPDLEWVVPAWADPEAVAVAGPHPIRAVSSAPCVTQWIIPALKDGNWSR